MMEERLVDTVEGGHRSSLMAQYKNLERQLQEELNRPGPDSQKVSLLKKQKLRIKECLEKFSGHDRGLCSAEIISLPERTTETTSGEPLVTVSGGLMLATGR